MMTPLSSDWLKAYFTSIKFPNYHITNTETLNVPVPVTPD